MASRINQLNRILAKAKSKNERATERRKIVQERINTVDDSITSNTTRLAKAQKSLDEATVENDKIAIARFSNQVNKLNARIESLNTRKKELEQHRFFAAHEAASAAVTDAQSALDAERLRLRNLLTGSGDNYQTASVNLSDEVNKCEKIERANRFILQSHTYRKLLADHVANLLDELTGVYEMRDLLDETYPGIKQGLYPASSNPWINVAKMNQPKSYWEDLAEERGIAFLSEPMTEFLTDYFTDVRSEKDAILKANLQKIHEETKADTRDYAEEIWNDNMDSHSNHSDSTFEQWLSWFEETALANLYIAKGKNYDHYKDVRFKTQVELLNSQAGYEMFIDVDAESLKTIRDEWFTDKSENKDKKNKIFDEAIDVLTTSAAAKASYDKALKGFNEKEDERDAEVAAFKKLIPDTSDIVQTPTKIVYFDAFAIQDASPLPVNFEFIRVDDNGIQLEEEGAAYTGKAEWRVRIGKNMVNEENRLADLATWDSNADTKWERCSRILLENERKNSESNEMNDQATLATSDLSKDDYDDRKAQLLRAESKGGYPLPDAKIAKVLSQYEGVGWKDITKAIKGAVEKGLTTVTMEGVVTGTALRMLIEKGYKVEALVDNIDYNTGGLETKSTVGGNVVEVKDTATKISWDAANIDKSARDNARLWSWENGQGSES